MMNTTIITIRIVRPVSRSRTAEVIGQERRREVMSDLDALGLLDKWAEDGVVSVGYKVKKG
jgi:hypothetical protein